MACDSGKIQYATVQDAHLALRMIDKNINRSVGAKKAGWHYGKAGPYKCHLCNQWHIGHHASKQPKRGAE